MECPYCAEEIKEQATFCKHCSRDLTLVNSLNQKIELLEVENAGLKDKLRIEKSIGDQPIPAAALKPKNSIRKRKYKWIAGYSIASITAMAIAGFIVETWLDSSSRPLSVAAAIIPTFLFGFLAARNFPEFKIWPKIITVIVFWALLLLGSELIILGDLFSISLEDLRNLILTLLKSIGSFATAAWSGSFMGNLIWGNENREMSIQQTMAISVDPRNKKTSPKFSAERLDRMTKIMVIVAPLLSFLGVVIASILNYMAAMGGK